MASSIRSGLALLLLFAGGCSGGGSAAAPVAGVNIDSAGGLLEITDGVLAGLRVEVPPGAAPAGLRLAADFAFAPSQPGFARIGRPVTLMPTTVEFTAPVTVTLPFDGEVSLRAAVLEVQPDGGAVEILDVATDLQVKLVTFRTTRLGTYWVADRLFGGVVTAPFRQEYLPLANGNHWNFDSGVAITATTSTTEPHLAGTSLTRFLIRAADGQEVGFYLRPGNAILGQPMLWFGEFSAGAGEDWQRLHDPSLAFLPPNVTIGQPADGTMVFQQYEPVDATDPTAAGVALVRSVVHHPDPLEIRRDNGSLALRFADVIRLELQLLARTTSGQERQTTLVLTLARTVGPVAVEVFGSQGLLTDARVGTTTITR